MPILNQSEREQIVSDLSSYTSQDLESNLDLEYFQSLDREVELNLFESLIGINYNGTI